MASKRVLKKTITYLVSEIVSDCFTYIALYPKGKAKDAETIAEDALKLGTELVARANHPDGKDNPQLVKKHYRQINIDLLQGIDDLFKKLSKLIEK